MQAADVMAAFCKAARAPALAGIYIKSISISAVRDPRRQPVLAITWSMPDSSAAIDAPALSLPGVSATAISRPANTAMLLPRSLANPAEIEDAVLNAAWALGAWDLCRTELPPLPSGTDWREPRYGIASAFGQGTYLINGSPLVHAVAPMDKSCALAAREGYITWRFVPLALATPTMRCLWGGKDKTLQPDCTRHGSPGDFRQAWRCPTVPGMAYEHQYQLGRGNHGNRSQKSSQRRA